jgi:flagellar biosynthesis component FlhA
MNIRSFNWHIWAGFLLSIIAFVSYTVFFVNFPLTRDFPWANLILFMIAAALLFVGVRRAFAPDRSRLAKVGSSILAALGVLIIGLFIFLIFVFARWLPASTGAPRIGNKAPEFTLADANGKATSLGELLTTPINVSNTAKPRGVLLIFYRGYW